MVTAGDPVEAFVRVQARQPRCVWLDGGGAREWSRRRSVLAWLDEDDVSLSYDAARREVTRHAAGRSVVVGDDPFVVLEQELEAGSTADQWFGYFGYAARPDLPAAPDPDLPDAVWMRPRHVRMYDHPVAPPSDVTSAPRVEGSPHLTGVATPDKRRDPRSTGDPDAPPTPADYAAAFARVQEHLHAGNSYEVNLTHRLRVPSALSPAAAYLRLRALNPAPYAGFLQHDVDGARAWLLGSSPERYALVTDDRGIETKPIKGTTPRATLPADDAAARERLRTDEKFAAENLMIVDLLRNDLGRLAEPGSVKVEALFSLERYPTVWTMTSTVSAQAPDATLEHVLRALFPCGSITGAPKVAAMRRIRQMEAAPRGLYCGSVGWLAPDGDFSLNVAIRTLVLDAAGHGVYSVGGGIVHDSDPAEEWQECHWKARILRA